MGSPSSRLDVDESLRPWLESGLEYIFNPGGPVAPAVVPHDTVGQTMPAQAVAVDQPQIPAQASAQTVSSPQPPRTETSPHHVFHSRQQAQPVQPHQAQPQQAQAQPNLAQPQNQSAARPVSNINFPEPWSLYLQKAKAPAPQVLWTYMELGYDLSGQSDPKRGAVFRNIINHLKWAPGTTVFWPMAGLVNNALQPDNAMFWKGWDIWKTPYVVCFGEEARSVILPDTPSGNAQYFLEHTVVYNLPPISQLMTMLPHEQQLSIDILTGLKL